MAYPADPADRTAIKVVEAPLREIRLDAGLTARELARMAGWHFTKVSKLEHGTRRPSPDDIRAWCRYCQAEDQAMEALRTRVGGAGMMAGQLGRLLALMSVPTISLGIIPDAGERHTLAQGSFWVFDDKRVQVETVSAGLDITQPAEIGLYVQVFDLLQRSAVHGHGARDLIRRALRDLSHG